MTVLATVENVTAELGGRLVLRDVSLALTPGEVVAVVGPNGAGKSSLLRVFAGLLQPSRGTVALAGTSLTSRPASERACAIAYLPQQRSIHWPLASREIVKLGRLPHQALGRTTSARDAATVAAAMAAMDVTAFADRSILALSGGEQARVLMARALAQEPQLLIADEPTAGLDLAHQFALSSVLRKRAGAGVSCLVALHDLSLAARVADRIVMMAAGQIVADGTASDVLTSARIAAVYGVDLQVSTIGGTMVFVPHAH